jgi:hypothetical protein
LIGLIIVSLLKVRERGGGGKRGGADPNVPTFVAICYRTLKLSLESLLGLLHDVWGQNRNKFERKLVELINNKYKGEMT